MSKIFRVKELRPSRSIRSPRQGIPIGSKTTRVSSAGFATVMTGVICLLIGLVFGAGLVAIPVATTAWAVNNTWEGKDFTIVKDQDVPQTKRDVPARFSEVVIPVN